jgi:aminopeptidase 2
MTNNWDALEKKLPPAMSMLGSVVSICSSGFTKQEQAERVIAFFGERSTKGFDQSLAQSLDAVKARSQWIGRDAKDVEGWLRDNGYLG